MTCHSAALCMAALLAIGAASAAPSPPEEDRPDAGWRQDSAGQWRGTGENFGKGWRATSDGQWRGTGENFGRGWRPSSDGGWSGTGENFGRGWTQRER